MSVTDKEAVRCAICDRLFFPKRNDARFCSAACRKKASRGGVSAKGKPQQVLYDVAKKTLYQLSGMGQQNIIKSIVLLALELLDDGNKKKIYDMLRDYPFDEK